MKIIDQAILYLVVFMFGYMIFLGVFAPYPNGRDAWFHILVGRAWYKGLNGMACPVVMDINKLPYAPIYHLMLAPFVSSVDSSVLASKIFQTLWYPLGLLFSMLLIRSYYRRSDLALVYGLLLTGTYYAFGMMQSRPQSMEVMLFPIAVWSLMKNKTKTFIAVVTVIFYLHSPLCIGLTCGLFYYIFRKNKRDVRIWATLLLIAPMVLYQLSFMFDPVIFNRWIKSGDTGILTETQQFFSNPVFWLLNGLGINVVGLFLIPYNLYKWRNKLILDLDVVMLLSFLGFLILLPVWYPRIFQFAMMPLAFFTAKFVLKQKFYVKNVLLAIIIVQAVFFTLTPVFWMVKPPYLEQYW